METVAIFVLAVIALAAIVWGWESHRALKQSKAWCEHLNRERMTAWDATHTRLERYRSVLADVVRERNRLRISNHDLAKTVARQDETIARLDVARAMDKHTIDKLSAELESKPRRGRKS